MPTVLAILTDGFEEIEVVTPIDVLRRADIEVTLASLGSNLVCRGRNGLSLQADARLEALPQANWDCLLLPGGPGVKTLRASAAVRDLVIRQSQNQQWLAAICAAPTVLHDAGLLTGRRYTAHFSVTNELPNILADERVVIDGKIVTSRGAGTALDFGLALVGLLRGEAVAAEVATAICC